MDKNDTNLEKILAELEGEVGIKRKWYEWTFLGMLFWFFYLPRQFGIYALKLDLEYARQYIFNAVIDQKKIDSDDALSEVERQEILDELNYHEISEVEEIMTRWSNRKLQESAMQYIGEADTLLSRVLRMDDQMDLMTDEFRMTVQRLEGALHDYIEYAEQSESDK